MPDGLLHATKSEIEAIFAPHAGLVSVMQSAKFDVQAVKSKLEAAHIIIRPGESQSTRRY